MKQKHIDAARELRLWIRDIIVPVAVGTLMIPDAREAVVDKYREISYNIKSKFKKK